MAANIQGDTGQQCLPKCRTWSHQSPQAYLVLHLSILVPISSDELPLARCAVLMTYICRTSAIPSCALCYPMYTNQFSRARDDRTPLVSGWCLWLAMADAGTTNGSRRAVISNQHSISHHLLQRIGYSFLLLVLTNDSRIALARCTVFMIDVSQKY